MNDLSNNICKCPERLHSTCKLHSTRKHEILIRKSTFWVRDWATESYYSNCRIMQPTPTVVFPDFRDWRAALSSAGPAALHYSSDLLDRWLGNIKSLLSAGAGPGSGGGDWGKGYTLAGCRLAGWCWWRESEKWPIFFFLSPNTKQILMKVLLIHGSCPVQPRLNPSLIWWFILV